MDILVEAISANWIIWFVSIVLIVAAVIDGAILKVPNWLTYPFILSGLIYWTCANGLVGFAESFAGMAVGTVLLLVLRNVGGMGAGDVKLLAGVGAWAGTLVTLKVFAATAITGGIIAVIMIVRSGNWFKHYAMARQILEEWKDIRTPSKLAAIARERKPTMTLLPYGIPMAIGAVIYFAFAGMLV